MSLGVVVPSTLQLEEVLVEVFGARGLTQHVEAPPTRKRFSLVLPGRPARCLEGFGEFPADLDSTQGPDSPLPSQLGSFRPGPA